MSYPPSIGSPLERVVEEFCLAPHEGNRSMRLFGCCLGYRFASTELSLSRDLDYLGTT
jgi:hypothetical protein